MTISLNNKRDDTGIEPPQPGQTMLALEEK